MRNVALFDLPPSVLRSFVAVAGTLSFTKAGIQLELGQSTISQHVRKLEAAVGQRLLARDTHSVALTDEGELLVEIACSILEGYERLGMFSGGGQRRPRLRLGISEDFAMSSLDNVLATFRRSEPHVDIELTVGLSGYLYRCFDSGELDIILAKRKPGDRRGKTAWHEPLVWVGRPGLQLSKDQPVPLVTFSPPSITRSLAIEALQSVDRTWHISCSSGSLSGLRAALIAGLGIAAHSKGLIPPGVASLPADGVLPDLPWIEFVVLGPGHTHPLAMRMVDFLCASVVP